MRRQTLAVLCLTSMFGCQSQFGFIDSFTPKNFLDSSSGTEEFLRPQLAIALMLFPGMPSQEADTLLQAAGFTCNHCPEATGESNAEYRISTTDRAVDSLTLLVRLYYREGIVTRREIRGMLHGEEWNVEQPGEGNHSLLWPQRVRLE